MLGGRLRHLYHGLFRCFGTGLYPQISASAMPNCRKWKIGSEERNMDLNDFHDVFDEVIQCLTKNEEKNPEVDVAFRWFKKVFEYNIPYGKKNRGMTVVNTFSSFASPEQLTKENIHLSQLLGWCVETFQGFLLVADDIVDQSETRRGKPCWYKQENVGLEAVTDVLTIENAVYAILRQNFRHMTCYMPLMELFLEATKQTLIGQTLDGITSSMNGPLDFSVFTFSRYDTITRYKTAYYSFYLPVAAGMHLCGISEEKIYDRIKPVLFKIGHLFQMQDDFIDCYGDSAVTGKHGNDIQEGKCSWLIVTALQLATNDQRNVLMKNYGKSNKENVTKVKSIYMELDLPAIYKSCEKDCYNQIIKLIKDLPEGIKNDIFYAVLDKIYGRKR